MTAVTQAPPVTPARDTVCEEIWAAGVEAAQTTMQSSPEGIAPVVSATDAFLRQGGYERLFSSTRQDSETGPSAGMSDGNAGRLVHGIATVAQQLNEQDGGSR